MRPLSAITDRFPRLLRELSLAHGKQVGLRLRGNNTLIERSIIEALQDPLMHLLRNSFDHGIESPVQRLAAGKPAQGKIEISAGYRGNQVVITLGDDGGGIDLDKIRRKVMAMGLSPTEIEASGEQELLNLIFEPGFSTADQVTALSGRGVGMDVVRSNLQAVGGNIAIQTQPGQGTTFVITVPLSLSVTRVLVVECQGMVMAIPTSIVEEMLLLQPEQVFRAAEQELIEWQGYTLPLLHLQDWLQFTRPQIPIASERRPIIDQASALVVTYEGEPYGIACDRYWGEQEATTRTVEGTIKLPQGFSGCIVLGDGRVVPLVEIDRLVAWILNDTQRQVQAPQPLPIARLAAEKPMILIVDDSINVRRFLAITLEKAGYTVEQARDGQEAIDKLRGG
ncbi:MAG: hybrid sensor histidine kinase/response regulator, partial [Synechococcales cyanobacterium RM1_1_8]|nr:hybrid sensor histidine kinase/response regulator [Synechococcales cyanobacterium RM1_1_8]